MNVYRLICVSCTWLLAVLVLPHIFAGKDFPEYWAAAHVLAEGGNPYNGAELLAVQQELATARGEVVPDVAVSLWTPPWTLPLYAPLGWLGYSWALHLWHLIQILSVVLAVEWLGKVFQLTNRQHWWLHVLATLNAPFFWLLVFGQNTGLLLLGLAGFLRYRSTIPLLAGPFAALTAIKPHLLAPFGVVLLLDVLRPGGWRTLLGGIATLLLASLAALALQPACFGQFAEALTRPATPEAVPLADWELPLLAYKLRFNYAPQLFLLQGLLCLLGSIVWGVVYLRSQSRWNWQQQLPWLVFTGALLAPYGGWIFDLVILSVPLALGYAAAVQTNKLLWPVLFCSAMWLLSAQMLYVNSLADTIAFTPVLGAVCIAMVVFQRHLTQETRLRDAQYLPHTA